MQITVKRSSLYRERKPEGSPQIGSGGDFANSWRKQFGVRETSTPDVDTILSRSTRKRREVIGSSLKKWKGPTLRTVEERT